MNMINVLAGDNPLNYESVFKLGYIFCMNYLALKKATDDANEAWIEEEKRKIK